MLPLFFVGARMRLKKPRRTGPYKVRTRAPKKPVSRPRSNMRKNYNNVLKEVRHTLKTQAQDYVMDQLKQKATPENFQRFLKLFNETNLNSAVKRKTRIATDHTAPASQVMPFGTALATKVAMKLMGRQILHTYVDDEPGEMKKFGGESRSEIAGREVVNYALQYKFSGAVEKDLQIHKQMTDHSPIQLTRWELGDRAVSFFTSSLNAKSVLQWESDPSSSSTAWELPNYTYPLKYPMSWGVVDDEFLVTCDTSVPAYSGIQGLGGTNQVASGDFTYNYPVVSRHADYQFFNSNAYNELRLKIYLVRPKSGADDAFIDSQPARAWFSPTSNLDTQSTGSMNAKYKYLPTTAPASELFPSITGTSLSWLQETPINLNAYPSLSKNFSATWDIVDVSTCTLCPYGSLNISMEAMATKMLTARDVINQKEQRTTKVVSRHMPFALMVEFQGQNGLMVPYIQSGQNVVEGNPQLIDAVPSKLRFMHRKYAKVAYKNFNAGAGVWDGSASLAVATAGIGGKNVSTSLPERNVLPYDLMITKGDNPEAGDFYIPIYTDQIQVEAQPAAARQEL